MKRVFLLSSSLLVLLICPLAAEEEVARALPVDPSEITPELGVELQAPPEAYTEAEPVDTELVKLADHTPSASADSKGLALPLKRADAVRLQIFLDENFYGPGIIDGKLGRFSLLAAQAWNQTHSFPDGDYSELITMAQREVPRPFAVAIVPGDARKWVNPALPTSYSEQAKQKRMSYRSYAEFMAERYHCDTPFLVELNSARVVNNLRPGSQVIVPNVSPFLIENLNGSRYGAEPLLANRYVVLNTKTNQARIYQTDGKPVDPKVGPKGKLLATFPITPGQDRFIKYGVWKLNNAVQLPVWRYDKSLLAGRGRSNESLDIPPGPNSPVGIIWMGLSVPGIGMHGTSNPETIGRARSSGCIRFANWDAARLPDFVRPGATVEIR